MDIKKQKVESVGEFAPKTKATLAALLGLSAALTVPATPADSTNAILQDAIESAIERNVTR